MKHYSPFSSALERLSTEDQLGDEIDSVGSAISTTYISRSTLDVVPTPKTLGCLTTIIFRLYVMSKRIFAYFSYCSK